MKRQFIAGLATILVSVVGVTPALAQAPTVPEAAVMLQSVWKPSNVIGAVPDASAVGTRAPMPLPALLDLSGMPVVNDFIGPNSSGRQTRDADLGKRMVAAMKIVPIVQHSGMFAIAKGSACLFVDTQQKLGFTPCKDGFSSIPGREQTIWVFEPDLDFAGAYKIRLEGTDNYLNIELGELAIGPIEPAWHSAKWRVLASGLEISEVAGLWYTYKP